MKFCFILFSLLYSFLSIAQIPDLLSEERDTLETIISDTSVIYVIQAEPVTIVEQVEVVKPKSNYYLTLHSAGFVFHEYRKAAASYELYLSKLEEATKSVFSYSIGLSLWKCPKKICTGYDVNFNRFIQRFEYNSPVEGYYHTNNYTNYFSLGILLGYWIHKEKKVSCLLSGNAQINNLLSYSSVTLSKADPTVSAAIRNEISYREYIPGFSLSSRFLIATGKQFIEVSPFITAMPVSATRKNEAYTIRRIIAGITIGISNRLF